MGWVEEVSKADLVALTLQFVLQGLGTTAAVPFSSCRMRVLRACKNDSNERGFYRIITIAVQMPTFQPDIIMPPPNPHYHSTQLNNMPHRSLSTHLRASHCAHPLELGAEVMTSLDFQGGDRAS